MTETKRAGWWGLLLVVLLVVIAWPPDNDKSLAMKIVNFAVDPTNRLPVLPPQLGYGLSDDPEAVEYHDAMVRAYDDEYNKGGWARRRLEWKVADDPFNKSTTRQVLLGLGAIALFVGWRVTRTV